MIIHLYTLAWNEARMLPFFFRHYDRFVDRYVIYDDGSTDGTVELLESHPRVEVRRLGRKFGSFLASATHMRNTAWKESRGRADWVIVTDVDEHIFHEDMAGYLTNCIAAGVTWLPVLGYQMISHDFPQDGALLCRDHPMGVPHRTFDKAAMFNPNAIDETNFVPGRHFARPRGTVVPPQRDELLNLHYKYLGQEFVRRRYADLLAKLGDCAEDKGAADHWTMHAGQVDEWMRTWAAQAFDVTGRRGRMKPMTRHPLDPRWWRPPPWWRLRWWHAQYWWSRAPARLRARVWRIRSAHQLGRNGI